MGESTFLNAPVQSSGGRICSISASGWQTSQSRDGNPRWASEEVVILIVEAKTKGKPLTKGKGRSPSPSMSSPK